METRLTRTMSRQAETTQDRAGSLQNFFPHGNGGWVGGGGSGDGGDHNVCYDILYNAFGKIHSSLISTGNVSDLPVEVVSLDYQS